LDLYLDRFTELVLFRLDQDHEAAARAPAFAGCESPVRTQLHRIGEAFELDETARQLLLLLMAADRDPRIWVIARAYHRDATRVGIDCATAAIALALGVPALLQAAEQLRRHDLITSVQGGTGYRAFAAMFAAPRVIEELVGGRGEDAELAGVVSRMSAPPSTDALVVPADVVASLRAVLSRAVAEPPVMIVQGTEGVGKRSVVAAVAAELGLATLVVDALELPHDLEHLRRVLVAIAREARLCRAVVFVDNADAVTEPSRRQVVGAMLGTLVHAPVLATTGGQVDCLPRGRAIVRLQIPIPGAEDREQLWRSSLFERAPGDDLVELADRYPVTPGLIARASEAAKMLTPGVVTFEHVTRSIGNELAERFRGIGRHVDKHESWDDLVLTGENRDAIIELISRVRHSRQVIDQWGFGTKLAKGLGVSALFSGEPGTGKTMVAALIAQELGLQLYQIDLAALVSKYIGETEKNLARAFDAAEAGHAVLLFDEADALFGKRTTNVQSSTDRYANMETNYLLQRIERFSGIAILTTNLMTSIDPAFQRRIAVHVRFEMPDEEVRTELWKRMIPSGAPREGPIDFRGLGRSYKFSGGYIRNAVLRAAYLAADEGSAISMTHLSRAADLEAAEMGRVV
jgi:AAA+ superfamily predicted ATPase